MVLERFKSILVVLLSLAACAVKEPGLRLTEESAMLDYKAGSWVTIVSSGGDWVLAPGGTYEWVTPSKQQGKVGEIISFKVKENLTGSTRSAEYRLQSGSQTREIRIQPPLRILRLTILLLP